MILLQMISRPFYECGIEYIDDDAFYGLSMITKLSFYGCSLTTAPSLQYVRSNLTWWNFARNPIQAIPDNYFKGCQNLRILRCASCELSSIPNLRSISETIQHVTFDNNVIASLSGIYDINFRILAYIELGRNNITLVEVNRLILPALVKLNLQSNMLMSLGDVGESGWGTLKFGTQIVEIYLSDNPWHCDKRLAWLSVAAKQVRRENVTFTIVDGPDITCASPPSLHGRSLDTIGK